MQKLLNNFIVCELLSVHESKGKLWIIKKYFFGGTTLSYIFEQFQNFITDLNVNFKINREQTCIFNTKRPNFDNISLLIQRYALICFITHTYITITYNKQMAYVPYIKTIFIGNFEIMIFRLNEFVELIAVQYNSNRKRSLVGDVSWGF